MSIATSSKQSHQNPPVYNTTPGADDINRLELPNGIVVLSRANFNSPSVFISGLLPAGALFDSDEKLGLADFTSALLMRGTENRSFHQIYESLESVGASLGVGCGSHSASFNGKALTEDIDNLLELLADILRSPIFPEEHVEKLRTQFLTSLAIRTQNTGEMATLAFDKIVYKDHPYSRPEDGYPETINAITQANILAFHQKHYGPKGMIVAIVGSIDPTHALKKVAHVLGDWQNPEQPVLPELTRPQQLSKTTSQRVNIPEKSQADIIIGAAGPSRSDPDFLATSLGNNILGQFGMMGRIGRVVREEAGLAYYASSSISGGPGPGPWDISAGVAPENIDQAIDLIIQEVRRFSSQPVSQKELEDSKSNFIGRMPLSLESNAGVAASLINIERYQLSLDYYRQFPAIITAITKDEVLEAAQKYLDPNRLGIAVAGP
jgi:zinc protease